MNCEAVESLPNTISETKQDAETEAQETTVAEITAAETTGETTSFAASSEVSE